MRTGLPADSLSLASIGVAMHGAGFVVGTAAARNARTPCLMAVPNKDFEDPAVPADGWEAFAPGGVSAGLGPG